ncbi:sodium pump decarboxylase gamma subunit [Isosphaera pallida ATCC 43644]|uniref:Sodium pump decarboxylase gamma subunit n=1 Tax=Isosphaera pallida (strain ATCC 43644 / DSM 9630 / IS1B) TaxID=575540 RepID=E8QZN5_ISOPI|nr:OadG family transporter subunit [Isosphaera pallida]ADV62171.1 sodium pump decarboxylase gamma subunit [Isosphaera pallida ATCC 43644]
MNHSTSVCISWRGPVLVWANAADRGIAGLDEGIALMVVGVLVVFVALALVGLTINRISAAFQERPESSGESSHRSAGASSPSPSPSALAASKSKSESDPSSPFDGNPRTLAVLSAAAFVAIRRPVRVVSVRHFGDPAAFSAWRDQGRLLHQSSHALSRRTTS